MNDTDESITTAELGKWLGRRGEDPYALVDIFGGPGASRDSRISVEERLTEEAGLSRHSLLFRAAEPQY
ncbi:hypothetical protein [Streptomyces sp. LUP30]|uniref:hypothetical protein n=1 Tax=Streptomyces sp. LUP30 TaxID=1890285 RepID=UPI000851B428|nr:hypothetical protein [Streptomyces sp. LUP30]